MKKGLWTFFLGLLLICALAACRQAAEPQEDLTIEVYVDDQQLEQRTLANEEVVGESLLDVMADNFKIETDGHYIQAIDGYREDPQAKRWWRYEVNQEASDMPLDQVQIEAGDHFVWKLEKIN
ncbi:MULTISPECIES: DUF4430 domain-containing protein [Aerococcus]|uniref:DUF4430 domain-containing protein n=1 Tax=Aerococcus TaxID=1375 RepID=UPI0008A1AE94|nr:MULTISPECIES: DUF4430 domain-containing protein [Aerococcus]MDK6368621.1 DUF4430 domain-containing protein [Aerococcus sp. UMB9870]MDK6686024.1 DUF4430 domain-containing protein [Aerococcus sp. UMB8623]OFK21325.1 hypothetical protein HMPREF2829_03395 [Aerococcus sp. HMSC072A12]OFR32641.1 hypothetical protein HMPREF2892_08510 [Aerococcus sp. HMSC061A03]OFT40956.1 hypothetical protein HMPREF3161_03910 [Aerococcus sp. HMSC06H08]